MKPSLRLIAPLALAVGLGTSLSALALPATATPAQPDSGARVSVDRGPEQLVDRKVSGRAAIQALGENLDQAAARNGMTGAHLRTLLTTDPHVVLYPTGTIAYTDHFEITPQDGPVTSQALIVPEAQTFTLESRPGSKRTIYLDFNGANVSGTLWNEGNGAIPNATYDGFSLDGNLGAFSTAEHEYIQEVWRIMSETYAVFDVNVTTKDLGASAYNRSSPADQTYGVQVLFSQDPDSFKACDPTKGCGGAAFLGQFSNPNRSDSYYEPAWVRNFGTAFAAAMAASHEVGHTLGLEHDGTTSPKKAYYGGQGAWTPIMGSGINAVHQFSNGDYKNASNKQDDFAVMASRGVTKVADEAGNSVATAATMGARNFVGGGAITGVISSRTDADVYKVGPCTTAPTVQATNSGSGSALDLALYAQRSDGSQIAFSNPTSGQSAGNPRVATGMNTGQFVPALQPGGVYYLKVDGVGSGLPSSTGYSDYGSVGTYTLTVDGCVAASGTAPNAPTNVNLTNTKSAGTVTWTVPAGVPPTGYRITGLPSGPVEVPAGTTSKSVTVNGGVDVTVKVIAFNAAGISAPGTQLKSISSWMPTAPPTLRLGYKVLTVGVGFTAPPNPGGATLHRWRVSIGSKSPEYAFDVPGVNISHSTYGRYTATVTPLYVADEGSPPPGRKVTYLVALVPTEPKIRSASNGKAGRPVTATARWATPLSNRGAVITSYRVIAYKLNAKGKVVSSKVSRALGPRARAYAFPLKAGAYRFRVVAYNAKGVSAKSAYSNKVTAR